MIPFDFIQFLSHVRIILIVFLLTISFYAIRMLLRLAFNKALGIHTKPYSTDRDTAQRHILILGDSTAVGTGARQPEDTIAGQLAHDFPDSQIVNLAQNGGLVRDLKTQLASAKNITYDLIVVSVGGNDVWHLTRPSTISKELSVILPKLTNMCRGRVIFLIYNNIGSAPLFPSLLKWWLHRRCIQIQDTIEQVAYIANVPTIELFNSDDSRNPFLQEGNELLFAPDGIHPSSEGYKLWYNRMWRKMVEYGYHY